jgi:hypothetical protein
MSKRLVVRLGIPMAALARSVMDGGEHVAILTGVGDAGERVSAGKLWGFRRA